jgi:hypothetical protein
MWLVALRRVRLLQGRAVLFCELREDAQLRCLHQAVCASLSVYPPPRLVFPYKNTRPSGHAIQPLSVSPAPIPLKIVKEVPDVPHLFGAEDRATSLSPTTSTHGYFIVVSFDELIY